jgi:hypothetical protein
MDESTTTLTMVRTECCRGYQQFGRRCSICPNRPENRQAVLNYKRESLCGLGCKLACSEDRGMISPSAENLKPAHYRPQA